MCANESEDRTPYVHRISKFQPLDNGMKKKIWFTILLLTVSVASLLSTPLVLGNIITTTSTLTLTSTITHTPDDTTWFNYTTRLVTSTLRLTSTSATSTVSTTTTRITTITSLMYKGQGIIGYIGCSNTQDSINGYQNVSTTPAKKLFWKPYNTIGGTMDKWADNATNNNTGITYWAEYRQQIAAYGQPKIVWIQICEDSLVKITPIMVGQVLGILRTLSPNAVFYISPLNTYSPVGLCPITGPNGVQDATRLADQAVSEGLALQGPILGPLTTQNTIIDHCHPNPTGQELLGSQLKTFFNK